MTRTLRELTLILLVAAAALAFSQVPRFVQEYEQRLGGAVDEATRALEQFHQVAEAAGVSFEDYVRGLITQVDPKIRATGKVIGDLAIRTAAMVGASDRLALAPKLLKPFVLAQVYDSKLLAATWDLFHAELTFDIEFGLIGVLLGWLVNALLWGLFAAIARPAVRRTPAARLR
jgi:DNA-binding phage protein